MHFVLLIQAFILYSLQLIWLIKFVKILENEIRKKSSKDKKSKVDWDNDGNPRKSKPSTFKSKPKFDDFDDDDDDLNLLKLRRELEKEDFEDDDED